VNPAWVSGLLINLRGAKFGVALYVSLLLGATMSTLVICWLVALRAGFNNALLEGSSADGVVVLRRGALSEISSFLPVDRIHLLEDLAMSVVPVASTIAASRETLIVADLALGKNGEAASVGLRGVTANGLAARSSMSIQSGRRFQTGTRELIVGAALARRLRINLGDVLVIRRIRWTVVGVMRTSDAYESEVWGDLDSVRNTYRQVGMQSMLIRFPSQASADAFVHAVEANPRLGATAWRQRDYFEQNSAAFPSAIERIAGLVGAVMAFVLALNAANSMGALAQRRHRSTSVLIAIGFRASSLAIATFVEALLLALCGSGLGWILAWTLFDGRDTATINLQSQQEVMFAYLVGRDAVFAALLVGTCSAAIGALVAAWRVRMTPASRLFSMP
jgi:putative ABC transport system permease protein